MAVPVKARRAVISWEGDAIDVLRGWPKAIREDFGVALAEMQEGRTAALPVRPMPSIAGGVFELKDQMRASGIGWFTLRESRTPSTSCIALRRTQQRQRSGIWPRGNGVGNRCNNGCARSGSMKSKASSDETTPHLTRGNVLDDLGFGPSEALEIKVKAEIYRDLLQYIRERKFTQGELGTLLGIHQPDVSHLLNGRVSKFSVGKLIKFAGKLNLGAQVRLTRPRTAKLPSVAASERSQRPSLA